MNKSETVDRRINKMIFSMTIFYQIVLNSSWAYLDTIPLWKYVGYVLYAILVFQFTSRLIHAKITIIQILALGSGAFLMCLFLIKGNLSVASVFIISGFALLLSVEDVLDGFFYAVIFSMLAVFLLAILGILPLYNGDIQYWVFGFKNPNNVGYYLSLIFSLLLIKQWQSPSKGAWYFLLVSLLIDKYWLHDTTALLVSLFLVAFWKITRLWPQVTQYRFIKWIVISSPFLLTMLAVIIGKLYGRFAIIYRINDVFTSRPAIWHYYMLHFPLKMVGGNVPNTVSVFRGAFDGAFIYYPLTNGLLVTFVLLLSISAALYYLLKAKRLDVLSFLLGALLFAFSENAPFFVYSSPLLIIALILAAPGTPHKPDSPALVLDVRANVISIIAPKGME